MDAAGFPQRREVSKALDHPQRGCAPPQRPERGAADEDTRTFDHSFHCDAQPPHEAGEQHVQVGDQLHDQLDTARIAICGVSAAQREGGTPSNDACSSHPHHLQTQLQSRATSPATHRYCISPSCGPLTITTSTCRCDSSPCGILRTTDTQRAINIILNIIGDAAILIPHDEDLRDDYKIARASIDQIMCDKRGRRSHPTYSPECKPPVPRYLASTFDIAFRAPDIVPGTLVPLKPAAPPLDQDKLEELGWNEKHFLDERLLQIVDWDKLRAIKPSNTAHIKTYYHDLLSTNRFEIVPRRDVGEAAYMYGKPVAKSDGVTARWVADPPVNKSLLASADVSVKFPRPEWIAICAALFRGALEIDADTFYEQFHYHPSVRRLFRHRLGRLRLQAITMIQGYGPATRVGHNALRAVRRRAFINHAAPHAHTSYVDNVYIFADKITAQRLLADLFDCAHHVRMTLHLQQSYTTTKITILGATYIFDDDGIALTPKSKWWDRAQKYLISATTRNNITVAALLRVLGVALWAMRTTMIPLALFPRLFTAHPGPTLAPTDVLPMTDQVKEDLRQLVLLLSSRPRSLLPCTLQHFQFAYVDATPKRIAAVLWARSCYLGPMPTDADSDPIAFMSQHSAPPSPHCIVHAHDTAPCNIAINELAAVAVAASHATPCSTLCVAIDSRTARAWAKKGWARNEYAIKIVSHIYNTCRSRHIRLAFAWVPSLSNLADSFSRDDLRQGLIHLPWHRPISQFETSTWC